MITQQAQCEYLERMFSLARQGDVLIPAQRRYFMRQIGLQNQEIARKPERQNGMAVVERFGFHA